MVLNTNKEIESCFAIGTEMINERLYEAAHLL